MTTRTAALALVAVILLAGCFGSPGSPTDTDGSGPGIGTPEQSATSTPYPAPGVGPETLNNATALLDAYQGSMTNVGFVATVRSSNRTAVYTYARDGSRTIDRDNGSTVIWTNGSASVTRTVNDGNATYSRPSGELSDRTMTRFSRLESLITSGAFERTGTTACGDTTCVVLAADGSIGGNYRNFTAELHVDRSGVIHHLDAEYVRAMDDRQFDYEFTVTQVGTESLERPDWVAEGLDSLE